MIREPKVGMRVKVASCSQHGAGKCGKIVINDGSDMPRVELDCGNSYWVLLKHLTEIKENGMTLKEAIDSGRRWKRKYWSDWKTIETCISMDTEQAIKNDYELEPIPKVKEVTAEQMIRDLKEKYGCEVKVTE